MPPQRKPVQLNAILKRTIQLRAYDFHSRGVAVSEHFQDDLPFVIGEKEIDSIVERVAGGQGLVPLQRLAQFDLQLVHWVIERGLLQLPEGRISRRAPRALSRFGPPVRSKTARS